MFDWTVHVSDLVTLGSMVGAGSLYLAKTVRKTYKGLTAELDRHQEELEDHRTVLQKMGWKPEPNRGITRVRPEV